MASYQTLSQELQRPLCKGLLTAPKFVGQCHHSACLECLEKLVAPKRLRSFQCPVCRQKCTIPPKGVAELNDDFRLQAIVEKYQKMKEDKSILHCTVCSIHPASHFCEECDKINLCIPCSKKHSHDPLTAAHEVVGICSKHGKKLAMYCRKCGRAICSVCLIADHPSSSQEHDVVPHKKVADEGVAEVAAAVDKLDRICERKENALFNIITVRESIVETINSDIAELGQQSDSAIEAVRKKQADLKAESHGVENQICNLKEQIETLMKRKDTVETEIVLAGKKETSLIKKKDEYSEYLNRYREACTMKFKDVVVQAIAETEEIKANVHQGREETSSKLVLDDQTVPSLVKVREELTRAITAAQQVDRVAPFVGVKERMARFVPNRAPMEIGIIQTPEFSKLTKFADFSFPADRPCGLLYRVQQLANGRVTSLYRSHGTNDFADTISLHDPAYPDVPQLMIDKNIHPAVDMTVTSKGELMVLKRAEPVVRVFNAHNGDFRDINISLGMYEIGRVLSIETDEEGNIFILDYYYHLVRPFHPDGALVKEAMVSTEQSGFGRMSYCRFKRTLYIANDENILRYHWDGTDLKEMASLHVAHDVDGFGCSDVCTGNDGEVFVCGILRNMEIRIYQVVMDQLIKQKENSASSTDEKELCGSDLGAGKDEEALCGSDLGAGKDEEAPCGSDLGAGKDEEALCGSDLGAVKVDDRIEFKMLRLNFDDDNADRTSCDVNYPFINVFGNTLALGCKDRLTAGYFPYISVSDNRLALSTSKREKLELFHLNP